MTSGIDDKLARAQTRQRGNDPRDNVVPLAPRLQRKRAALARIGRPPGEAAGRPAGDGHEDDPGPNAA